MIFSSTIFIFYFLPAVLICYFLINDKFKNIFLLFASLFFYSWGEPKKILIMILSIILNWLFALIITISKKRYLTNFFFVISILFNLGLLLVYKYTDFFIRNINSILNTNIHLYNIVMPIGISFFTFQSISYIIDVKRKSVPAQKNIFNLGLYISFFPQLIAGPIVRYIDIEKQINNRQSTSDKFNEGALRFMIGFSKKILIADQLALYIDPIFEGSGINAVIALFGIIAYSLQIYFDFSGYSDMAIGLGKFFGFDFNENFDYPYISKSIKEFWKRWHISLSSWFKDYIYIPLGGSRCSKIRSYLNLMFVFLLTGFWHGASWNFIFWGLYFAFFLILERLFLMKILKKLPNILQHFYAICTVVFGWIFFRSPGLKASVFYIKKFFYFTPTMIEDFLLYIDRKAVFFLLLGILFSTPLGHYLRKRLPLIIYNVLVLCIFIIAISFMLGNGFSPFLYFRF